MDIQSTPLHSLPDSNPFKSVKNVFEYKSTF